METGSGVPSVSGRERGRDAAPNDAGAAASSEEMDVPWADTFDCLIGIKEEVLRHFLFPCNFSLALATCVDFAGAFGNDRGV